MVNYSALWPLSPQNAGHDTKFSSLIISVYQFCLRKENVVKLKSMDPESQGVKGGLMLCMATVLATSFARGHINFYLSESIQDRRPGADNELLYSGVALPPLPSACIPLQPSEPTLTLNPTSPFQPQPQAFLLQLFISN